MVCIENSHCFPFHRDGGENQKIRTSIRMAVAHAGTIAILIRTGKGGLRTDGGGKTEARSSRKKTNERLTGWVGNCGWWQNLGAKKEERQIKRVAFYNHFVWQFGSSGCPAFCVLRSASCGPQCYALCPTCKAINFRFIPSCYLLNKNKTKAERQQQCPMER